MGQCPADITVEAHCHHPAYAFHQGGLLLVFLRRVTAACPHRWVRRLGRGCERLHQPVQMPSVESDPVRDLVVWVTVLVVVNLVGREPETVRLQVVGLQRCNFEATKV